MMDYFTSDWHLGHYNSILYSDRPFEGVEEMSEVIVGNLLSKVKKGDNVFFLGDMVMNDLAALPHVEKILKRRVNFFWIVGNHDKKIVKELQEKDLKITFLQDLVIKRQSTLIHLSHFPMLVWEKSFRNSFHLYGHIHKNSPELAEVERIQKGKALNVNVEFNDYNPYSLTDIFDIMASKEDNWDYLLLKDRVDKILEERIENAKKDSELQA